MIAFPNVMPGISSKTILCVWAIHCICRNIQLFKKSRSEIKIEWKKLHGILQKIIAAGKTKAIYQSYFFWQPYLFCQGVSSPDYYLYQN